MNQKIIFILVALLILLLVIFGYVSQKGGEAGMTEEKWGSKNYKSENYGLAFNYSEDYFLEEKMIEGKDGDYYLISLTEDTEENRLVREGKAPGREGPVSIEIKIYENTNPKKAILEWVQGVEDSNFKLSNEKYEFINVNEERGLRYHWSGLYEADSWVVGHKGRIVSFTVQYISVDDSIFKDFGRFVNGIKFF